MWMIIDQETQKEDACRCQAVENEKYWDVG